MDEATCSPGPLVLLDRGANFTGNAGRVVHWAEVEVPQGHDSVPLLVENQAQVLRQEYLAWVHDLGEHRLKGRTVKEHLRLGAGASYWWMTLVAAKDPSKAPAIYTVFKLRALERLYLTSGCRGIILRSGDPRLHQVLSDWCARLGHPYRWDRSAGPGTLVGLKQSLRLLPNPIKGIASLVHQLWTRRRSLFGAKPLQGPGPQMAVFTYFPNIDHDQAARGVFRSRYWGKLQDLLEQGPWQVNWVWIYGPGGGCSFPETLGWRDTFNRAAQGRARHYLLEEFLTPGAIFRANFLFLRLFWKNLKLKSIRQAFHFPGSALNFWPILADDWRAALTGSPAIHNCLAWETFRSLVKILPQQEMGLYLWENQLWERALIFAWEKSGHGKLLGFQHATLRFLDLRFYEDPRSYGLRDDAPPIPQTLVVNGAGALKLMQEVGYPNPKMRVAEAVRYLYLQKLAPGERLSAVNEKANGNSLLVVTGYLPDETAAQLRLLSQAVSRCGLNGYERILVKPHPYCPVAPILQKEAPDLEVEIVQEPLNLLWPKAKLVFAANSTSASLEAALQNLPILVHVVEDSINFSPLLGQPGVRHVGTVYELCEGLNSPTPAAISPDYFCLEERLARWQSLLKM